MNRSVSIVVPAYNEGVEIIPGLSKLVSYCSSLDAKILVVVDRDSDTSFEPVTQLSRAYPNLSVRVNDYGPGPANAIRFGIDNSNADVIVVTMSDGCDDHAQIPDLVALVNRGVAVASASRYMPGGQQVGGPRIKRLLSRLAGMSLWFLANVGTRDATNSFKAYSREFLGQIEIESRSGFEIGIELVSKARRLRLPVAEIPTTWIDRSFGESNFKIIKWIPAYVKWYFFAFARPTQAHRR